MFPEASALIREEQNSDLFHFSEMFADKVLYRGFSGQWFVAYSLLKARNSIAFSKSDEYILVLTRRLTKGKASKYLALRLIGKGLSIVYKYTVHIREYISSQATYDINLLNDADGILCDITAEKKDVNTSLRNELKNITKFSMLHGLDATWLRKSFVCKKSVKKRLDLVETFA